MDNGFERAGGEDRRGEQAREVKGQAGGMRQRDNAGSGRSQLCLMLSSISGLWEQRFTPFC